MKLLFLHGWGFDSSLWVGVCQFLAPIETRIWDRGYFGRAKAEPVDGPLLVIGHSLGSLLLAADPPAGCVGLIAINGFDRFSGAVPQRVMDRMQSRFAQSPREVVDAFRVRCGASPTTEPIDERMLGADFERLAHLDVRGGTRPMLVLHGGADPILPGEMRAGTHQDVPHHTMPNAGHLLPLTHPEWCAAQIRLLLR